MSANDAFVCRTNPLSESLRNWTQRGSGGFVCDHAAVRRCVNLCSEGVRQQRGGYAVLLAQYLFLARARQCRSVGTTGDAELAEQRGNMVLDRALRAVQSIGDRAIRNMQRQQIQHLAFACSQAERTLRVQLLCPRRTPRTPSARSRPRGWRRRRGAEFIEQRERIAQIGSSRRATPVPAHSDSRARPRPAPHGADRHRARIGTAPAAPA